MPKSLKPYNIGKLFGKRSHLEVLKPRANIYTHMYLKYEHGSTNLILKAESREESFQLIDLLWPAVIHFNLRKKNGDLKLRGTFCPMRSPAYNDDWTVLRKSNQSLINL